ncbi:XRE family transcriptional regulator [Streptomyces sp. NPDC046716]|uniref:helix-turn-helix domain-containing protein n=1 Tax=Streptomyces sp. NPDC046716 TaxID=3157093 RepID=UPI0033F0648C
MPTVPTTPAVPAQAAGTPSAAAADGARDALSVNLNRRRLAGGWSLRELSAATGVSKGLLSQIERAEANPTLDVLHRVASALGTDPAELLRRSLLPPHIVRADELDEPDGETSVNLLFAAPGHGRTEIYRSRLHPHSQSQLSSHGAGSVEYVMVVSGRVDLVVDDVRHHLAAGDSARFDARVAHFYSTQDVPAVTHSIVGYPMS